MDRQHHQLGYGRLKLRPVDMAQLGSLYLNHGRWKGDQLVPASWVRDATSPQVKVDGPTGPTSSYGYQWWVEDLNSPRSFLAWGFGGQLIRVTPEQGLVMVVSEGFDMRKELVDGTGAAPEITGAVTDALDAQ